MNNVFLAVFIVAASLAGSSAVEWNQLSLSYQIFGGFFDIPLTKTEAVKNHYSLLVSDEDLKVDFYAYKEDPRVTIGYDSNGNIAGVRIYYIKSDLSKTGEKKGLTYDYSLFDNDAMYSSVTYNGTLGYINTILFTDPEALAAGGRSGVATKVGNNVYIKLNGVWTAVPTNECDAIPQGYTDAACFPTMGKHYFYNATSDMDCNDFKGLFMMYESGELIGLGITVVGSHTDGAARTWFESPGSGVYKLMMPTDRPKCVTKQVDDFGTTSLHFFFKKYPRLTFCLGGATKCDSQEEN